MIKVVAENINIMSKYTGNAMREKDPKPIQEWAVKLTERGADLLDLNLGPGSKRRSGNDAMACQNSSGSHRSSAVPGHHQQ